MERFWDPKVQGALRHFLSMLGPILVMYSAVDNPGEFINRLVTPDNWVALIGATMAFLALVASWKAPEKQ